jgi:hypothetical protein
MAQFPDQGILWRGWNDETLRLIREKDVPVLLFVADPDPMLSPFLKVVFETMPGNARLRDLLHERHPALFLEADALPEELKLLGAGSRFHIAVLSPSGLTPMVTIDPSGGTPATIVDEIVRVLERLDDVWR